MFYDENLLTGEQKKIEDCYQQIGLRYYAYHKDNPAPELADLVAKITESKLRISEHKAEVLRANGQIICPNCGQQILQTAMFCNFCGLRISAPAPAAPVAPAAPAVAVAPAVAAVAVAPTVAAVPVAPAVPAPVAATPVEIPAPEPVREEPVAEAPAPEPPVAEEPAVEEPVAAIEEPVIEEPVAEVEEPVFEETAVEEPAAETPIDETPPTKPFVPSSVDNAWDPNRTMAATDEEIEAYASHINGAAEASNQNVCRNCGKALDPDCAFCTECGTPVGAAQDDKPAGRVCSACGFEVTDSDAVFCNNCGTRLESAPASNDIFSHSAPPRQKRCPFCGFSTTDPELNFCIECGSKLI